MKMTASLLTAYDWYLNCPPNWKDRALEGLHANLTEGFTASPATIRGGKYEDKVNHMLKEGFTLHSAEEPLNKVKGLPSQVWLKPLTIETTHGNFLFRGRMDYIDRKNSIIYDLKTTKSVVSSSKYLDGKQHLIYCLAEQIDNFEYIVARFEDDEGMEPTEVVCIPTTVDLGEAQTRLVQSVDSLCSFLKEFQMWDDYFKIFNKNEK